MAKLILPRADLAEILRERRHKGIDRRDEVWDGVYVMSPEPDNQHQKLSGRLFSRLEAALEAHPDFDVYPSINISDQRENWRSNFRIPDVAVFAPGNHARDLGTHWLGGPDFAIEILSRGDRSRKKFGFYHKVGVRELLLINRNPWTLELYARDVEAFSLVGKSTPDDAQPLASNILPLTFRLAPAEPRPQIQLTSPDGTQHWSA